MVCCYSGLKSNTLFIHFNLMPLPAIVADIQISEGWYEKSVLNADAVCKNTLYRRQDSASYNGCANNARALTGMSA